MTITLYDCATAPSPRRARILLAEKGIHTLGQAREAARALYVQVDLPLVARPRRHLHAGVAGQLALVVGLVAGHERFQRPGGRSGTGQSQAEQQGTEGGEHRGIRKPIGRLNLGTGDLIAADRDRA